jgi:hypothetical protein
LKYNIVPDIESKLPCRYYYRIHIECTTRVEIEYFTRYRRFFFDIDTKSRGFFYSVLNMVPDIIIIIIGPIIIDRYRKRYRGQYIIFNSKAGASVPRPPSAIDSNEDREMDFCNHRDYIDQDIPAGQFLTAQSGPIAQFLNGMPDWINMTPEDISVAVETRDSLPNP